MKSGFDILRSSVQALQKSSVAPNRFRIQNKSTCTSLGSMIAEYMDFTDKVLILSVRLCMYVCVKCRGSMLSRQLAV